MFEFVAQMTLEDLIVVMAMWITSLIVGTILVWKFVIPPFMRDIIIDMIADPSPKTQKAIQNLAVLVLTAHVKSGKKVKDEDGKEHDEIVPLLVYAGRELFSQLQHKFTSSRGGKGAAQMEEAYATAVAQSGGDVNALLPIAIQAAVRGDSGPLIGLVIQKFLNKPEGGTTSTGGNYLK
jgi:hypothetical protein